MPIRNIRLEDERKPEASPVVTYRMSREEMEAYLREKYGDKLDGAKNGTKPRGRSKKEDRAAMDVTMEDIRTPVLTLEEYLERRVAGMRRPEICKEFGIDRDELIRILREWGLRDMVREGRVLMKISSYMAGGMAFDEAVDEAMRVEFGKDYAKAETVRDESTEPTEEEQAREHPEDIHNAEDKPVETVEATEADDIATETAEALLGAKVVEDDTTVAEANPPTNADDDTHAVARLIAPRKVTVTMTLDEYIMRAAFEAIVDDVHETAVSKGWHETKVPMPIHLALIHSEVSEALEADRKGYGEAKVAEELADVVIRVMDTAAAHGLDLAGALFRKMAINKERAYRHGGRKY
ncbi:nucleoside triphosphate pyrophosphohydrolase family protein [Alicyclobacillus vulcanalis]|uniref:Uncharacterized protein n=1 Tax=Alicyclobacillus vulcanalis TaxID=252246 RepID=A0A1N7MR71_9BACL|nr:hypothetical protein [Alicyclobacillus vulcanalis]SIS88623.1 hypothetical protein SAMN05421799_10649 [Alicyclobacillus vulcanalis]